VKNLLIYYGWLSSFNSAENAWTNEKVAQDLAKYGVLVLGDGLQEDTHGDYTNTETIIARVKVLNPNCQIFGYVTTNQSYNDFKRKTDEWNDLEVHGIFMDESGYDYGKDRDEFNDRVDYVHSRSSAKVCFVNAWKPEHILSNDSADDDASYANSTYNPEMVGSNLFEDDWYLLESFGINASGGYESATQWKSRGEKARSYNIKIAGCSIISDTDSVGQDKFDFGYIASYMHILDAYGTSDTSYGASSAKSKMWARPAIKDIVYISNQIVNDSSKYLLYLKNSRLTLDFSSGSEDSEILNF